VTSKIDAMIAAYKRDAEARGKLLLEQQRQWSIRHHTLFPSTLSGDRGATSPLGGQAKPTEQPKQTQHQHPQPKDGWW
jgi:hypothetical protein